MTLRYADVRQPTEEDLYLAASEVARQMAGAPPAPTPPAPAPAAPATPGVGPLDTGVNTIGTGFDYKHEAERLKGAHGITPATADLRAMSAKAWANLAERVKDQGFLKSMYGGVKSLAANNADEVATAFARGKLPGVVKVLGKVAGPAITAFSIYQLANHPEDATPADWVGLLAVVPGPIGLASSVFTTVYSVTDLALQHIPGGEVVDENGVRKQVSLKERLEYEGASIGEAWADRGVGIAAAGHTGRLDDPEEEKLKVAMGSVIASYEASGNPLPYMAAENLITRKMRADGFDIEKITRVRSAIQKFYEQYKQRDNEKWATLTPEQRNVAIFGRPRAAQPQGQQPPPRSPGRDLSSDTATVRKWQQFLVSTNSSAGRPYLPQQFKRRDTGEMVNSVDGMYGFRTKNATRVFQRDRGLPATGLLDERTLSSAGLIPRGR